MIRNWWYRNRIYHAWVNRCWRCLWDPYHSVILVDPEAHADLSEAAQRAMAEADLAATAEVLPEWDDTRPTDDDRAEQDEAEREAFGEGGF